ncbi:MAG: DUF3833 family protein [Pseudomonadota bacterium]
MRNFLATAASLALVIAPAFLTSATAKEAQGDSVPFTLEDYFVGKSVARGVFVSKIAGANRAFDVYLDGQFDGTILTLREDFVFADGEKDRKTWVFEKIADNQYRGTREDVVGDTLVTIKDNVARFSYLVEIKRKDKDPIKVRFKDKMILKEDGLLLNRARVSKFGFPIANVQVNFRKGTDIDAVEAPNL